MSVTHRFVRVLRSADLHAREGLDTEIRGVRLADEIVLLGRLADGRVVAFGNSCPHETTDLRQATFVDGKVRCPRHNYLYDPVSGENVVPTRVSRPENLWKLHPGYLPTHAVEERDGWVWVDPVANAPPATWDPAREEPPVGATEEKARPEQAEPEQPVTVEMPAKHLRVRLGAEFELRLPLGTAAAHTWTVEAPRGLLAVVDQRLEAGSSGRQRVRIAARALGQGTLRCSFGRPWDPEPEEIRTYLVDVVLPS